MVQCQRPPNAAGAATSCTSETDPMARLVDTNVLVYRFDPRDPVKQQRATELLEAGLRDRSLCLAHQSIVEFVAVMTRPLKSLAGSAVGEQALMPVDLALSEAEILLRQWDVIYPTHEVLMTAMRGMTHYRLQWFDAQIWAIAEVYGLDEVLSEDFQHGRHYGRVRAVNPFLDAPGVQELPALYEPARVTGKATGRIDSRAD